MSEANFQFLRELLASQIYTTSAPTKGASEQQLAETEGEPTYAETLGCWILAILIPRSFVTFRPSILVVGSKKELEARLPNRNECGYS